MKKATFVPLAALAILMACAMGAAGPGSPASRALGAEPPSVVPNVITFDLSDLPPKTYGESEFDIGQYISTSSGLDVLLESLTPESCAVVDGTGVWIVGAGECIIEASQDGKDAEGQQVAAAAIPVSRTIQIDRAPLTLTTYSFGKAQGQALGVDDFLWSIATVVGNDDIWLETIGSGGAPASATSAGGPYPIIATLSDPNGRLGNYDVVENFGFVTVNATDVR